MLIRALTKADACKLQECRLVGLAESPEAFLVNYREVAGTPLSQVESELEDPDIHYIGAFNGERLVGFMRYVRPRRESRRHTAEVRSVYVRSAARAGGVGSRLLAQLVRDARAAGIESLNLSVLADNTVARRLYASAGFRLHGTEPRAIKRNGQYTDLALYWLDLAAT